MAIKTADPQIDEVLNLLFSLALLTMDNWSPIIAATIQLGFENPQKNQKELSQMLQKSQSSISEVLNALINAGLKIEFFNEYTFSPYSNFKNSVETEPGKWHIKGMEGKIPMVYSLRAGR